ncbi:phosphoribosyltransferase family protein [Dinghuibacter silviterrae]|uniref:Ribose-phosphate pyrophosphokinase n=1 Tax=Dinghuibacter silviterrae TaxID=1539049 RepID=A0A4R8DFA9_9BACT|nr:phosphoribosyltransferase family protein [Dinghuibacter silviterrae]TDW96145.1 ribose-phosphate pyrophosphokinase [Dinghuibacter silviterrae]
MYTFNLIYPNLSDIPFHAMVFPDGQPHVKLKMEAIKALDRATPVRILSRLSHANDLMTVLFVKNTLDYLEFEHVELHVSYLLAARMDRVMLDGEPFSLKVVAQVLNQAQFRKVKIFDPHSEVSTALIDRSYAVSNHTFVQGALKDFGVEPYCLVSPDAGALKKIHKLASFLGAAEVVECMKERDLRTGALTHFKTTADDLEGKTCVIVDDICDGGGTFAGTAALLKGKGAAMVVLVVSHGIFSKGPVIDGIDKIYTTDSYRLVEGVHTFPISNFLL